jgi:hypothetical protein
MDQASSVKATGNADTLRKYLDGIKNQTDICVTEAKLATSLVENELNGRLEPVTTAEERAMLRILSAARMQYVKTLLDDIQKSSRSADPDACNFASVEEWRKIWMKARFAAELANGEYGTMSSIVHDRKTFTPE